MNGHGVAFGWRRLRTPGPSTNSLYIPVEWERSAVFKFNGSKSNGSSGRSPLNVIPRGGSVTIVESGVARSFVRRAVIAFFVVTAVVGLLSATVASHYMHPILGAIVGVFIGGLVGALVGAFVIAWPVLRVLWHWAAEIGLGLGLVYGWVWLMTATHVVVSLLVVVLVVGVPATVGPIRRQVTAWSWCLIVRHRLRLCFARLIRTDRDGTLPLILLARPTPVGERVWVWLRPGLSIHDLEQEGQMARLAVACWANEVRVERASRSRAALVRVDITRRETLTEHIGSPLPGLLPKDVPTIPVSPATPPLGGLDLADVLNDDLVTASADTSTSRKPRNPRNSNTPSEPDNSEYA
ncbi:hypothetical protein [Phytohabitans kaempferiae]|uniref:Uncharacterized protein n=1 Tax=Phytohabitans kaempferiae TaxID=1620943 RepID=A0ABV6M0V7_9ACTN